MSGHGMWKGLSTAYVTPRPAGQPDPWVGTQRLLEVDEVVPPPGVVAGLQLDPGDLAVLAVVRRRLMLLEDRPVELTDSYYPASIARGTGLAEARKIRGGAVTLLAELGYAPCRVREDITARPARVEERQSLELGEDDWVLVLTRIVLGSNGLPVEASVMTMVARGCHLGYELTV